MRLGSVHIRSSSVCAALFFLVGTLALAHPSRTSAQSVCLPSPRLLTTMPMGGKVGSEFEVTINGQNVEDISGLLFSHPGIKATPLLDSNQKPIANRFRVSIAPDCPIGIYEARVASRLGISTARAFNVGDLNESTRTTANTQLETAKEIQIDSICNAYTTRQAIDYYRFTADVGQRLFIDCAATGIDSKLKPVVIIADENGADLMVERRGGVIDFNVPSKGTYVVKVHDLTYNGGSTYFYRLAVRALKKDDLPKRLPSTRSVNAFSWPPATPLPTEKIREQESDGSAQTVSIPCQIHGRFFPAADVDVYEFTANKGEQWWVEVASERLGRPTDPAIVVQQVVTENGKERLVDIAQFSDIASPVKISSNGYSYDGPPYNAGSTDLLGKLTIPSDGTYRIQISDLFGGTRNDPQNIYQLVVRKAQPDFAVVAWGLHMNLRNGDRNALSKPLALRPGATYPLEVVVVRRDGFQGEIELTLDNLPPGVTAAGLTIPAGASKGHVLVTADPKAPAGMKRAIFQAHATIDGKRVTRKCQLACMKWPVPNAWSEIPNPRLIGDMPVSVGDSEFAPLTIRTNQSSEKVWEVETGGKLTLPLVLTRRIDFSGANITLKTMGAGFERNPGFDVSLNSEFSETQLDLAKLKIKPGNYTIAFYGSAVAKYSYNPGAVSKAAAELQVAKQKLIDAERELKNLQEKQKSVASDQAAALQSKLKEIQSLVAKVKTEVAALEKKHKRLESLSRPKDIVDIIVSTPIQIRVVEKK